MVNRVRNSIYLLLLIATIDLLIRASIRIGEVTGENIHFNSGIAFGVDWLGDHAQLLGWVIFLVTLVVTYLYSHYDYINTWFVLLMWAALPNSIERIIYGNVTDYVCAVGICFNLADILVNIILLAAVLSIVYEISTQIYKRVSASVGSSSGTSVPPGKSQSD